VIAAAVSVGVSEVDLLRNHSSEPVKEKEDLTAQVLDWARDRAEALEGNGATSEAKPVQEVERETPTPPRATEEAKFEPSSRIIVVAHEEGTNEAGEAHLFEDFQAAGQFVETLVEDGLDPQRLTVFNCTQLNVHLSYRAVVRLKTSEEPAD